MGNPVGRPPKFRSAAELQARIDAYFEECAGEPLMVDGEPVMDKKGVPILIHVHPPTVTGLAVALGFHSRQSLLNYQAKKEFMDAVTRAKLRIEQYAEERLYDRDGQRGAEFNLRYNFRWGAEEQDSGTEGGGVVLMPPVAELSGPTETNGGAGDGG